MRMLGKFLVTILISESAFAGPVFDTLKIEGALTCSAQTANTVPYFNGSKVLTSSSVTPTQLEFINSLSSNAQTQISSKVSKSGDTMTGQLVAPSFQALDSGETLTASHDSGNDTMLVESSKDLTLKAVNDLYLDAAAIRTGGELYHKGSHVFSPDDSKSFDITYDSGSGFFKLDSASPVVYNAGEFQINGVNGVLLQTGSGSAMAIGDAVIVNSQGGDGIELNGLASDAQIKMKGGEPFYFRSPSDSGFNHYSRDGWLVWFGELESSSYIIHNEAPSVKEDVFILDVNGEVRLSSFNDKGTYLNSPKGVAVNLSSDPTAHVDVAESDSNKASLRIRSGSAPSTPNDGDVWSDGADLNLHISGSTKFLDKILRGSATLDFPITAGNAVSDLTMTVTGAAVGDVCALGIPHGSVPSDGVFIAWVSASDTVTVRYQNNGGSPLDPASGTFKVNVSK